MRVRKTTDSPVYVYSDPVTDEEEKEAEVEEEEEEDAPPSPEKPSSALTPPECRSVCKTVTAEKYADHYGVPPEYGLQAPRAEQRANAPPEGFAAIYTQHFRYGLRLPLPPFVAAVLNIYKIALAQLHPNGVYTLLGFIRKCEGFKIAPTTGLFQYFFRLLRNSNLPDGWFTFQARRGKIVSGQPSPVRRWKSSFLFFKTSPEKLSLSWNDSPVMEPPLAENERPCVQAIITLLAASAKDSSAECEDSGTASLPEKAITKGKSFKKNEASSVPVAKAKKKRKRMAEFYATEPAKAQEKATEKEYVDEIPSVPGLKDMTTEQFARFIQNCVCSFNLRLEAEKEELEKIVEAKEHDKNELKKDAAAKERDLKDKEDEVASLKAEVSLLEDRENEIASLQGDKVELQKKNCLLKSEIASLKARVSWLEDRVNENVIASAPQMKNDLLKFRASVTASFQGYKEESQDD